MIEIRPFEERGIPAGIGVAGEIIRDQPLEDETVGHLNREHWIEILLFDDFLNVFLHAHVRRIVVIAGTATSHDDPCQATFTAKLLACFIHSARQFQSPIFGVHHHFDSIQGVTLGIVIADVATIGDCLPVVPFGVHDRIDDQAARRGDDFSLVFHTQLAFGEDRQLAFDLLARPTLDSRKA